MLPVFIVIRFNYDLQSSLVTMPRPIRTIESDCSELQYEDSTTEGSDDEVTNHEKLESDEGCLPG